MTNARSLGRSISRVPISDARLASLASLAHARTLVHEMWRVEEGVVHHLAAVKVLVLRKPECVSREPTMVKIQF